MMVKKITDKIKKKKGFTLVELLIVVIILAVLAAIVVPQFSSSTDDAKLSALQSDLAQIRSAIELYYHQHNSLYPGGIDVDGSTAIVPATVNNAFISQLTKVTSITGEVSPTGARVGIYKYGPYIKSQSLPINPFTDTNTATYDLATVDYGVASAVTGTEAWKYYVLIGRFVSNTAAHIAM